MFGQKRNKAILFTMDAIFAGLILVVALTSLSQNFIYEDKNTDLSYLSYDIVKSFSSIKTNELNNSYLKQLIADGVIENTNNTILETIGELYVLNKTIEAENLAKNISYELIPPKYGFAVVINNEIVYSNGKTVEKSVMTAKRLISGIERYKPIRGSTSKVYLEGLDEKKDSSYIFFGGFIGQGNISEFSDDIPIDADITNIYAQLEIGDIIGDNFNIYFNNILCEINLTKNSPAMTADAWNLTSCKNSIIPGARNNVSIIPQGSLDSAYISGGFIRFDYKTKQMYKPEIEGYAKFYFPSIDGLINIYNSIYIPGVINDMNLCVKYFVNHTNASNSTFYLKVGNSTVFSDTNSTGITFQCLDGSILVSFGMNYSFLSEKNIPIRMGAENVSYFVEYLGTADAIIVTDVSGSMADEMGSNNGGINRSCTDPLINASTTQRLSVAKCLDKTFASNMLNITGNKIGLVSYTDTTDATTNLTNNITKLTNDINYYTPLSSTCICCGINSGANILLYGLNKTIIVYKKSLWNWTNYSFNSEPANDSSGNRWYDLTYLNETQWSYGNASLGNNAGTPTLVTDMGSSLFENYSHPYLWENSSDLASPEADFTHGWNSTGNYFGNKTANNGWDYDSNNGNGPYDYDDDVNYTGPLNGVLYLSFATGNPQQNRCSGNDCSGAYGIEINITPALFNLINQSNGKAILEFNYDWTSNPTNPFETSDEVWIKSRWTSPTSGVHYLGSERSNVDNDNTLEVDYQNNPDTEFNGLFSANIKNYIEGPGNYYLDFGAKLYANSADEWGIARFDNVSVKISNTSNTYYLRKHFNITNMNSIGKVFMNIMSDDSVKVYLNGYNVHSDNTKNNASYWNIHGKSIDENYLRIGDNVLAVELLNSEGITRFDLEMFSVNDTRNKAMIVMTDGQANQECTQQGTTGDLDHDGTADTASDDAIQAACDAKENWGITTYAVGYSDSADEPTLKGIAECGNGLYLKSSDTALLDDFYKDVAAEIMDVTRIEQKIIISGSPTLSKLYGEESYIEINYTPPIKSPEIGEISVNFESSLSQNCTFNANISSKIRIIDSKVSSYSSSKWTDFLFVNNITTHNLSLFNADYQFLGDPYIVSFLPTLLNSNNMNNITVRTGIEPTNSTGCSLNDTFFYTGLMKSTISYSEVLEFAEGCKWTVEFENNSTTTLNVPQNYYGANNCTYKNSGRYYNANDTYDDAAYKLFNNLDLDNDGRLDVNLVENNLVIGAISVQKVPYPWGPAIAEVRVWQ